MSLRSFFTLHNICATTSIVVKSYRIGPLIERNQSLIAFKFRFCFQMLLRISLTI